MNSYAIIILIVILGNYLIDLITDYLNLKNQTISPPAEFADLINEKEYGKNHDYLRINTIFGQWESLFSLVTTLIFWFLGGFNLLDKWCMSQSNDNQLVSGLLFIGVLLLLRSLLGIPFSIYSTFVIEERFGFNQTTWKTFIFDRIKAILLSLILGTPLLVGIIWFFQNTGDLAWIYAWLITAVFTLGIQLIAPTWIMPLFNKFSPLPEGDLKEKLLKYGEKVNFPLTNVFVVDGSKRSGKGNAFFTGFGKQRRVALFDTLIKQHTVKELLAVLAHEIGHYKRKHIITMTTISIIHQGIIFFLMGWFLKQPELYQAFFMNNISIAAGLIFFSMLFTPVEMILNPLLLALSRRHEFQADKFAAETTGEPETMVSALKKLAHDNLSNLTPHPFYVFRHYSHPPLLERINTLRESGS